MENMKKENLENRTDADPSVNTRIEFGKFEEIKSEKKELTISILLYMMVKITTIQAINML
jgi:hypothetical protein